MNRESVSYAAAIARADVCVVVAADGAATVVPAVPVRGVARDPTAVHADCIQAAASVNPRKPRVVALHGLTVDVSVG